MDGNVRLFDSQTLSEVKCAQVYTEYAFSCCFSPDNSILATGGQSRDNNDVKLLKVSDLTEIKCLKGHSGEIYGLCFTKDQKTLASSANDNLIILWNLETYS